MKKGFNSLNEEINRIKELLGVKKLTIENYQMFLESKNVEKTLVFKDDNLKFNVKYTILGGDGDEIEVSYNGYYIDKDDVNKFENDILDLGENEIRTFIEETIEDDIKKYLNVYYVNFIYY